MLVAVTLLGALPVYRRVAEESPHGQGSIAMLERLLPFWKGKVFVLVLLGFAATDFVITMTLSAADASAHLIENPNVPDALHGQQLLVTLVLLALLGGVFLRGFREAIGIAVALVGVYLLLNVVVIGVSLWQVATHPSLVPDWGAALTEQHGDPIMMVAVALMVFPQLALGLSGFETGVAVMPHVRGGATDTEDRPRGRIRGTKRLLTVAAVIMSLFLVTSSFVTTLLIPASAFETGGEANGRALAFLAHELPRQRVRHDVRRVDDRDPLVRRRVGDGRPAQPDPALPAPLRHGTRVGRRRTPAGAGADRLRVPDHVDLRRRRRRPGRGLRDRRPGADHQRGGRRDPGGAQGRPATARPSPSG